MTVLFEEGYESGTSGAALTTSNTTWTAFSNAGAQTINTSNAAAGSKSCRGVITSTTAYSSATITSGNVMYLRWYGYWSAHPTVSTLFANMVLSGSAKAQLLVNTDGTIQCRNASTASGTASGAMPLNTLIRFDWRIDGNGGTQVLKAYWGSNINGTTPDATTSGAAFTNASMNTFRLGPQIATTWTYYVDEVKIDDSTPPGPLGSGASLTGIPSDTSVSAPAGSASADKNYVGPVCGITAVAPAGSVLAGSAVNLTGALATTTVYAPWGHYDGGSAITLAGVPAPVTIIAPDGGVFIDGSVSLAGPPSEVALNAPSGAISAPYVGEGTPGTRTLDSLPGVVTISRSGEPVIWNGVAWIARPARVWDGTAWTVKAVYGWTGSAWTASK